jgi:hypothetical protein
MNAQVRDNGAAWRVDFPREAQWLDANAASNSFAASLRASLMRYGSLTDRQLAAVQRSLAPRAAAVSVGGAGFDRLVTAFGKAQASGLKRPKLHIAALTFSLAPLSGANAGALYVKDSGIYLGKITSGGEFYASRDCRTDQREQVETVARDPLAAAVQHGRTTGNCAVCSRPLSDPESVARGIGPICAERFGF